MTAVDPSSFAGLTAMVLFTLNLLLGLLVKTNSNPLRQWPRRKLPVPLFKIHDWTAYLAVAVVVLHPTILLFSSTAGFKIGDILRPLYSPGQRTYNNLGALTFYTFALVVATSYFRPRLGYRPWKKLRTGAGSIRLDQEKVECLTRKIEWKSKNPCRSHQRRRPVLLAARCKSRSTSNARRRAGFQPMLRTF